MKRCNTCGQEKDLSGFHVDNRKKDKHKGRCKECISKTRNKEKSNLTNKIRRDRIVAFVMSMKYPCLVCGEDEKACIDWHHVNDEEKEFKLANARDTSMDRIKKEIDKCVCLCANCHRKVHAGLIDLSAYVATT